MLLFTLPEGFTRQMLSNLRFASNTSLVRVLLRHFSLTSTAYILIGWLVVSALLIGVYAYYFNAVIALVAILWILMQVRTCCVLGIVHN